MSNLDDLYLSNLERYQPRWKVRADEIQRITLRTFWASVRYGFVAWLAWNLGRAW